MLAGRREGSTLMTPRPASAGCGFCQIVAGCAPASVVYGDDEVLAFLDRAPVNPGHLLVIPKPQYPTLAEVPEATGARLFTVAARRAGALRCSGVRCEGVHLFLADGEAACQEVAHCHLHVVPRLPGDRLRLAAAWS